MTTKAMRMLAARGCALASFFAMWRLWQCEAVQQTTTDDLGDSESVKATPTIYPEPAYSLNQHELALAILCLDAWKRSEKASHIPPFQSSTSPFEPSL
ncbi:hypothetical protein CC80DRAFT_592024 [Byssothecium circinans]|uniref:Secreted protein n=1 Tax=Byssothecium circinans TaxID=147558 RepID=A0A6A5U0A6_9PLEO|nr:hypothetical protein CC80DRAFT_592024 [Byssothecium circinans]